jgi:hypothetical protein
LPLFLAKEYRIRKRYVNLDWLSSNALKSLGLTRSRVSDTFCVSFDTSTVGWLGAMGSGAMQPMASTPVTQVLDEATETASWPQRMV